MNDFSLYSPTRFVFGRKVTDKVGETLSVSGHRRALIVYGKGSVVRCGTLGHVKASLDAAGVEHIELRGVRPNPEIGLVREGVELARENDVDIILPVGGGSAMDCAKAIALGAVYDGDVWDFFRKRAVPASGPRPLTPALSATTRSTSNAALTRTSTARPSPSSTRN